MGLKIGTEAVGGLKIGTELVGGMKIGTDLIYQATAAAINPSPDSRSVSINAGDFGRGSLLYAGPSFKAYSPTYFEAGEGLEYYGKSGFFSGDIVVTCNISGTTDLTSDDRISIRTFSSKPTSLATFGTQHGSSKSLSGKTGKQTFTFAGSGGSSSRPFWALGVYNNVDDFGFSTDIITVSNVVFTIV